MSSTHELLRVALYARVSGEEQKQGHNIDSQIAELQEHASRNEWPVIDIYKDEAWSGAALARPALDRLRDDAGKKLFDGVLINDVDRLARDVTHLGVIKRDLERSGVRVIFRKIPSENSPMHNLLVNILGSFAEFEREMIMDRTRRGRRHKVETRQQFIGCIPPYGYAYSPSEKPQTDGSLAVNPAEAAVVREMFNWVDRLGLSAKGVALRLDREGIPPRKSGSSWQTSTILRILHGTIYMGTWYYYKHRLDFPKTLVPGGEARARKSSAHLRPRTDWVPVTLPDSLKIISIEQWTCVQRQIDRNRSYSPRNSNHEYLLSGLVRCGGCQSRYVGNPSHGRFEYRCYRRCKRVPLVGEDTLNGAVWTALETALNDPATLTKAIEEIKRPAEAPKQETDQIEVAIQKLHMEETRILEAYRLSILTSDQLARELESIANRRKLLEKQAQQSKQPRLIITRDSVEESCRKIRERLPRLTFETKRSILRLLLRKVVYEGDQVRISGVIPLEIDGGIAGTMANHCDLPVQDLPRRIRGLSITVRRQYPALHEAQRRRTPRIPIHLGGHLSRNDSHRGSASHRRRRDRAVLPSWSTQRSTVAIGR
jgi:site-specific DNA recombinase